MNKHITILGILLTVLLFACAVLGSLSFVPEGELRAHFQAIVGTFSLTTRAVLTIAAVVIAVWLLASLVYFLAVGWAFVQKAGSAAVMGRLKTEEYRVQIARQRFVIEAAPAGSQIYKLDVLENLTDPLHLAPGRLNGKPTQPTQADVALWLAHNQLHATARRSELGPGPGSATLTTEQPIPALLEALTTEQRLLLLGPSGSGKSSLLRHVVSRKLDQENQVILCDPHGSRPKWGDKVDAVGFGENFAAILDMFRCLEWEHKQRIQAIAEGRSERDFPIILCVIEEIQALVEFFTAEKIDIGHYVRMFLTRTRKTGIDVLAVTQADTVSALGLRGYSQNKGAFALVKTSGRDGRGHRVEYLNEFGEVYQYEAPPLWPDTLPVGVTQDKVARLRPAPTLEQIKIIDALSRDPGATDYAICKDVWGKQGTSYKARIEEVKALFGPF